MKYTIRGDSLESINLEPETEVAEILQNVLIIINSIEGQIPLARGLGLKSNHLHETIAYPMLKISIAADITDKLQKYEPRAVLENINFEEDHTNGILLPILEVSI